MVRSRGISCIQQKKPMFFGQKSLMIYFALPVNAVNGTFLKFGYRHSVEHGLLSTFAALWEATDHLLRKKSKCG